MQKTKKYDKAKFSTEVLKKVFAQCTVDNKMTYPTYKVTIKDESWKYDDVNEFYSAYRNEEV